MEELKQKLEAFFSLPNWRNRIGPWKDINEKIGELEAAFLKFKESKIDDLRIDEWLFNILDEHDGFKYKSTLSLEELRKRLAGYALACMHDKELAQEAFDIVNRRTNC